MISPQIMGEVEAAMRAKAEPLSYAGILEAVGQWSKITVKHAVRQLIEAGRVERIGTERKPLFQPVEAP